MIAALLAVTWAGASPAAESLRWRFRSGEAQFYRLNQRTVTVIRAMGQEYKTSLTHTIDFRREVKSVTDGVAEIRQVIERVRTRIESPQATFEFDSHDEKKLDGPIQSTVVPLLNALAGAEFHFKMDTRGEFHELQVPAKLREAVKTSGQAGGEGMLSEEGLRNMIAQTTLVLPESDGEKGTSWNRPVKVALPMIGTLRMDRAFTITGPDEPDARLVEIKLITRTSLEPAPNSNIAARIRSQEGKGEFRFDQEAGRLASSRVVDKLEMSLSVMGQELIQSTDSTTMLSRVDRGSGK